MSGERLPIGVFTTDTRLAVRAWDAWMATATGVSAAQALGRPINEVIPTLTPGALSTMHSVLSRGVVEVMAQALHHYLFACAPLEASAAFQQMQQHVTVGPLRDDSGIVGVVVTVEDVTARVAQEREAGHTVQLGSLSRLLGADNVGDRRLAVTTLAQHGEGVVDAVVTTLREQHADLSVLSSVLDLLSISDIDVVDPLIRCLDHEDTNLRIQAALILGQQRDRRAIVPLVAHLSDPDVNVRFHAIEALDRLHAVEAADALTAIALDGEFFLAFAAIAALSRLGNSLVAPRLVPLLSNTLLRGAVIDTLGDLGDEDVTTPLVRLLDSVDAPADAVTHALAGLYERYERRYGAGDQIADLVRRELTPTGTQNILDAVAHAAPDRLAGLARVLGWLHGDAVHHALTRLLGQQTVRSHVVEALVRNGAGVVPLLVGQLRAEDLDTRHAAAVALGRIGDRRATGPLVAALDDQELAVVAAGALARIGDLAAFEALLARLGDGDSAIRRAVIAALNSIGHPDMPRRIAPLLDDADPLVRESAIMIAGYFGYPGCLDQVLARCQDDQEAVRRTAIEQLAFFEDTRVFPPLERALAHDTAPVRAAAAAALARVEQPGRVEALVRALDDDHPWVRFVCLRSLGAIGDPAAVSHVVARLTDDPAPHVRLAAIEVIGRMKPAQALEVLGPLTRSANGDIARAAIAALGGLVQDEALVLLEHFGRAPDPRTRLAAVDALARRADTQVPDMLQWIAAVDQAPEVAAAAIDALARVGGRDSGQAGDAARALMALTAEPSRRESAITALSGLPPRRIADIAAGLGHASTDVRCACVEALGRMKRADASRALEQALDDRAGVVRVTAIAELKHLGTRTSQKRLLALARTDPDADVRHAAMRALARAGEPNLTPPTSAET